MKNKSTDFLVESFKINFDLNFDAFMHGYNTDWKVKDIKSKTLLHEKLPFPLHPQYLNEFKQDFEPSNFYRNIVTLCGIISREQDDAPYKILIDELVQKAFSYTIQQEDLFFVKYNYQLNRKGYKLEPGWVSALGNGFLIRALARIKLLYKNNDYDLFAKMLGNAFFCIHTGSDIYNGRWFSWVDEDGYLWFDEYPGDDGLPSLVLNGHIHALHGIYYYIKYFSNPDNYSDYYSLYQAGLTTLKYNTMRFRRFGRPNRYSLREYNKDDYLPDRTVRQQMELYRLTGDPVFKTNSNIFSKDILIWSSGE